MLEVLDSAVPGDKMTMNVNMGLKREMGEAFSRQCLHRGYGERNIKLEKSVGL